MNKIFTMLKMDGKLVLRDKIVLYMALAPVLLALVTRAVMGGAGQAAITFAAAADVPQAVLVNLGKMAHVQVFDQVGQVQARVERADSAAGVYMKDGQPALMLEGSEPAGFRPSVTVLLARAVAGDMPAFESRPVVSNGNVATTIVLSSLLLLALFMGGAVAGFHIVAERESRAIRALAVSPLTMAGYLGARTALAALLCVANTALCGAVMGVRMAPLAAVALASIPVCGLVALALGATAANQIAATATIKILMPACLMLPISSVFVPEAYRFLYWWLPVYWQYEAVSRGLAGEFDVIACALTFATGLVWFAVLSRLAVPKLGLR